MFLIGRADAQVKTYSPNGESYIMVKGTSTLHDWEMISENVDGVIRLKMNGDGVPGNIDHLVLTMQKATLKSSQSGLDRRAYDALNAGRHPEITFRMDGPGMVRENGDSYIMSTEGYLTVAGETRKINVRATCVNGDGNRLICSGSRSLKMSDFDIDPPVMMFGALRTGDEVTVDYRLVYTE